MLRDCASKRPAESMEEVNVRVAFVSVRRSVLELKPSGPRWLPTNRGHSDGFSLRAAKELRGEVCGQWARSNASEDVEI